MCRRHKIFFFLLRQTDNTYNFGEKLRNVKKNLIKKKNYNPWLLSEWKHTLSGQNCPHIWKKTTQLLYSFYEKGSQLPIQPFVLPFCASFFLPVLMVEMLILKLHREHLSPKVVLSRYHFICFSECVLCLGKNYYNIESELLFHSNINVFRCISTNLEVFDYLRTNVWWFLKVNDSDYWSEPRKTSNNAF